MNIFEVVLSTAKSKISPALGKVKMWTKPSYIKNKFLVKFRNFILKIFDVRPKDEADYYTVGVLMISKKLAFAVVILVMFLCGYYIWLTLPVKSESDANCKAYKYNSMALKFADGKVEILGKSGYTAYIGNVEAGVVSGTGTLYRPDGSVVYTGEFDANKYNGTGKLYDENENLIYEGAFEENLYQGEGKEYRKDGSLLYEGEFTAGRKNGAGKLYDSSGNAIYTGNFQLDEVRYQELLGKATSEVAEIYTGKRIIYESDTDYCVYMQDISAVYCGEDGTDSLDGKWTVSEVYVLKPEIGIEGVIYSDMTEIEKILGEPVYEGNTNLSLPDEVALNLAIKDGKQEALFGEAALTQTELYSDAYQIENYEKNYTVYLYVFEKDGILYQFFCKDTGKDFSFYSIE
jgi:hypothetical protein